MTKRPISPAGVAATVAAVVVVIAGLVMLGTPGQARARRLDGMRVNDLSTLSLAVDEYWAKHAALPATLDTLVSAHQVDRMVTDPQSNRPYTYLVSGERSYRLCATFQQPSDTGDARHGSMLVAPNARTWRHGAGESCFDLTPPPKDAK
jgi:hypothetical protein